MRINLRIKYAADEKDREITCSASDLVAFEEKYNRSVAKLQSEFKLTDLMFLAWRSETRTKHTTKEFETWLDDIDTVEVSNQDPK
jgi:hypothetical protein